MTCDATLVAVGILEHRVDEEQFRLVMFEQRFGGGAVGEKRHADEPHALQLQEAKQVVVTGVFDEHGVARLEHIAHDEIERLIRAARDQYIRQIGVDAERVQTHHHLLAQVGIAVRNRVIDHARYVETRHMPDRLRETVHIAPDLGDEAARQFERLAGVIELLSGSNLPRPDVDCSFPCWRCVRRHASLLRSRIRASAGSGHAMRDDRMPRSLESG